MTLETGALRAPGGPAWARAGLRSVGLAALVLSSSSLALGASLTWNGSTSGNWFIGGNWTPAAVPTSADTLVIDNAGPNTATVGSAGAVARTLTIGSLAGSSGALVVNGAGTLGVGSNYLIVGDNGSATLTISGGGKVTGSGVVANNPFSNGQVTISGAGSQWSNSFLSISADNGAIGRFRVEAGGKLLSSGSVMLAETSANADGQLLVTGAGSDFTMSNAGVVQFRVGAAGKGDFQLLDGATASTRYTYLGGSVGSLGSATVSGGASWTTGPFTVGPLGQGELTVSGGGKVTTVGTGSTARIVNGKATVTGAGSQWKIDGSNYLPLGIGSTSQTASLDVLNGGAVLIDANAPNFLAADLRLADGAGQKATITIDGAGSSFTTPYRLYSGNGSNSTATVIVSGGGRLNTGYANIASASDATLATADTVTVTGADSVWAISNTLGSGPTDLQGLTIGGNGKGALTISNGGKVQVIGGSGGVGLGGVTGSAGTLNIGAAAGSPAAAPGTLEANQVLFSSTATGPQAINFNHTSGNYVFAPNIGGFGALAGPAAVNILAGTTIFTSENAYSAVTNISPGAVLQLGNGGTTGSIRDGVVNNDGTLIIDRSADIFPRYAGVVSGTGTLVKNGTGLVTLVGVNTYSGGTTINTGELRIGDGFAGDGALTGNYANHSRLSVYFNGTPSYSGIISGAGSFEKTGNGSLTLNGIQTYTGGTKVTFGTLLLGGANRLAPTGALTLNGGIFDLNGYSQTVSDLAGYGRLVIGTGGLTAGGAADTSFNGVITGSGTLTKEGSSTLTLALSAFFPTTFTGTTNANAGTLKVDGAMASSNFQVNAGGTLTGSGSVGATTVASGGTLAGRAGQSLTLAALTLNDGSNINAALGAANTMPLFDVTGNLTLDGRLTVSDAGGFGNGTYRIANYGGTLTNNGLVIGSVPPGFNPGDWSILAGSGTINLLVATGAGEQYWDGANMAPGGVSEGRGGNGTWDAPSTNWTNSAGTINAAAAGQKAVFAGVPGTVSVVGAQTFTGLRFASHPSDWTYTLAAGAGGLLVTNSAGSEITVAADPGVAVNNAVLNVGISGTGSIVKLGQGKLTLGAAGSYQGGTLVREGELVAAVNGALGSGAVSVSGAPAATQKPSLRFAGPVDANGLAISTQNGSVVFDDRSSAGSAVITNQGNGSTVFLAGSNAGTASITNQGGGTTAFRGDVTSAGARIVNQDGGKVDLSTFDAAGLCNCVSLGSVSGAGDVLLGAHQLETGALNLDESISGVISDGGAAAKGSFAKTGTGTLILSGANTYLGTTTVKGGLLRIDGTLGSADMTVASGATLGGVGMIGTQAGGTLTVQAGGHHAPGASIGTQTINGNYRLAGTLDIEIDPGRADKVVVTGNVDLSGGTLALHELSATGWQPSQSYTIIDNQGANAVVGRFASIAHLYAFLTPAVSYTGGDGNNVVLTLDRNQVDFASVARTPNQKAAAGGIESLAAGNSVYNTIAPLAEDEARHAFDQLSGEVHAATAGMLLDESQLLREAALARAGAVTGEGAGRGFWIQGTGLARSLDSDGNAADASAKTGAMFSGVDSGAGDWTLGFLGGISISTLNVGDRNSSADVTSVHLGAYAGGMIDTVRLKFGAGYSHHDIDTSRTPQFAGFSERLKSDYGASSLQVFGEVARPFDVGTLKVEPFAGLAYVRLSTDDFSESGGAAALGSGGYANDAGFTTLGARLSRQFTTNGSVFDLSASLGWRHAFADTPAARLSFTGGTAFTVYGLPVTRDALALQAGFGVRLGATSQLGLRYDGQFGSGGIENAFKASFSTRF
ncbi:MAG TPA: autotransporter domain-containing protein [Mesorhizobium sp.]|jgi:outer membrane autotransporter protein|uniref:autotransporter domain-containing protein n=1 Tax=Mesorhizobium sp. TaxID=1871066 RepID=UPI002DDD9063|nr:autotransporter domain-containing protein [Mesorhizobium sp.]HEV2505133.1 autotransporter domain-containing protein [Mesorhizobium sp.]